MIRVSCKIVLALRIVIVQVSVRRPLLKGNGERNIK